MPFLVRRGHPIDQPQRAPQGWLVCRLGTRHDFHHVGAHDPVETHQRFVDLPPCFRRASSRPGHHDSHNLACGAPKALRAGKLQTVCTDARTDTADAHPCTCHCPAHDPHAQYEVHDLAHQVHHVDSQAHHEVCDLDRRPPGPATDRRCTTCHAGAVLGTHRRR